MRIVLKMLAGAVLAALLLEGKLDGQPLIVALPTYFGAFSALMFLTIPRQNPED